ncbi:hypothetical protein QVD17_29705 [Tagetes erecta]|uniref:Uncharacterized protein n=1 Tax=Tagetes erecta TaxID=13708 RepID=A0AAD8K1E6_TARER|nr:hypothetical protein QVD17_29705 [Tagetes erecta]
MSCSTTRHIEQRKFKVLSEPFSRSLDYHWSAIFAAVHSTRSILKINLWHEIAPVLVARDRMLIERVAV